MGDFRKQKAFRIKSAEALYNHEFLADVNQGEGQFAEVERLFRNALEGGGETYAP